MRNEVKVGQLPNGFRFYSQYDWSGSTNLAGIGVKAGAIHAPPGCVGLPHLVEHLLARESLKYPPLDADLIFKKILGNPDEDINIRIDKISTNFGFGDLLRREDMLLCLDVMAQFLRDRILTSEGIDVEKSAVYNECHLRGRDIMPVLLDDLMHQLVYERNPARYRIDGEIGDIEKIKRSQIKSFINKHYVAGNMFLIVFGPKFDEVRKLAEKYFGDWEAKPQPQFNYDHSDGFPVISSPKSLEVCRDISQHHLALGFPTENYMSRDAETLDALAKILAFRLGRRLRDGNREFNGGVYRANVDISRSFIHGLIYASFATVGGEFVKMAESAVIEELQKLKRELVNDRELDAVVYRTDTTYREAFRKAPLTLAEMVIEAVCNGDEELIHLHSFRQRLYKVKPKKILAVANKYFGPNYIRVLIKPA